MDRYNGTEPPYHYHVLYCEMHKAIRDKNIAKVQTLILSEESQRCKEKYSCCFAFKVDRSWKFVKKLFELNPLEGSAEFPILIFEHLKYPSRVQYLLSRLINYESHRSTIADAILRCAKSADVPAASMKLIIDQAKLHVDVFQYSTGGEAFKHIISLKEKSADTVFKVKVLLNAGAKPNLYFPNNAFHAALTEGDFNNFSLLILKELLGTDLDVNELNAEGVSPIMLAMSLKNVDMIPEVVQVFVETGANLEVCDKEGNTALICAAKIWDPYIAYEVMRCLLEAGAEPMAHNNNGVTALSLVYRRPDELVPEMLKLFSSYGITYLLQPVLYKSLYEEGFDCNTLDEDGNSPLILATQILNRNFALKVVHYLLETGANPNLCNKKGDTALHFATLMNTKFTCSAMVKALLNANANPSVKNSRGETPLLFALTLKCQGTFFDVATSLVKAGANTNIHDENGDTPLHFAAAFKNPAKRVELVKIVLGAEANPSAKNNKGRTPLMTAIQHNIKESFYMTPAITTDKEVAKVVKMLLHAGSDVNAVENELGWTALHFAVKSSHFVDDTEVVELLLDANADISVQTTSGDTPLHFACAYDGKVHKAQNLKIISLLLKAGSNPNSTNKAGENVLFPLARSVSVEEVYFPKVLKLLLDSGADICAKNFNNATPLLSGIQCTSCENGNYIILVKEFFKAGAYHSDCDDEGTTTLMHALASVRDLQVVKVLIAAGADVNVVNKLRESAYTYLPDLDADVIIELFKSGLDPLYGDGNDIPFPTAFFLLENTKLEFWPREVLCDVIKTMQTAGVDFFAKDKNGNTTLMYALKQAALHNENLVVLVKSLLDLNVDVSAANCREETALLLAIYMIENTERPIRCLIDCFTCILNAGMNPFLDPNQTPLDLINGACELHHPTYGPQILNTLLRAWRDSGKEKFVNSRQYLESAISHLDPSVALRNVQSLLEYGANPLERDQFGVNSLDFVCSVFYLNDRNDIVKCLLKAIDGEETERPMDIVLTCEAHNMLTRINFTFNRVAKFLLIFENDFDIDNDLKTNVNLTESILKRIFDYGFLVSSEDPENVSSLTSFLMIDFRDFNNPELAPDIVAVEEQMAVIMKDLISRGSNPYQRLLTFQDEDLQQLSQQLQLPDSLWLAGLSGFSPCVRDLLPYWPAPPLALVIFLWPMHNDSCEYYYLERSICNLLPLLLKGGPLPHGSQILSKVQQVFNAIVEQGELEDENHVSFLTKLTHFQKVQGEVPSLLNLCRVTVRGCFSGGVDLPDRIAKLPIPGTLIDYLSFADFTKPAQATLK